MRIATEDKDFLSTFLIVTEPLLQQMKSTNVDLIEMEGLTLITELMLKFVPQDHIVKGMEPNFQETFHRAFAGLT